MKRFGFAWISLVMLVLTASADNQLAFPGAEGFGRFATGGRGGTVYHVTTLSDSGTGSLRDAVSKPNRIIVFDVSGVIKLSSRLVFSSNLYVAGQTAPGEGITVYGNGVSFSGSNNIIVRYVRFRMGSGGDSGKDAAGIANGTTMIFDHLSVSWGLDETFSINSDGKGSLGDITIQNTIMSQGLMTHSAGGLMQADHITLYRNLYVDNSTRNNKIKGTNQYVNNIVYNWKNGCYLMGGDSEGMSYCNASNNFFMNGPSVGGAAFTGGNGNFHIWADDNWQDKDRDGTYDPYSIPQSEYSGPPTFQSAPYDYPALPAWKGSELIDSLLPTVGASLPYRDPVDFYVVSEVMSFGKEGALISKEAELPIGIPTAWRHKSFSKPADTDGDGMPDEWESTHGTNPAANDAMTIAANGYANIENYINGITIDDRVFFLREPFVLEAEETSQNSVTLTWRDYTEGEDGFAVEMFDGTGYQEVARIAAADYRLKDTKGNAAGSAAGKRTGSVRFVAADLQPATAYSFRVRAYKETEGGAVFSEYAVLENTKTQPEYVAMIEWGSYEPDLTWDAASGNWNYTADCWDSALFTDGAKVLLKPEEDVTVTIDEPVAPAAVVVGEGNDVTFAGAAIGGEGTSVNKFGAGVLDMGAAAHTYTGATALHDGTLRIATLKDGGVASSIGASQEFAQNWIWNGGTWQYTGGNTATNRSAKLYRTTTFDIAAGSTVTMNGALDGVGGLTLRGGKLTVGTTNFFAYTGATRIEQGGNLYLSTTDISKKGLGSSPKLVLAGGTLSTKGENSNYETYSFPIEVEDGTYSYLQVHRNCSIANRITGTGTLELDIPYVREYVTGNWDGFNGHLVANGVGTEKDGTQLMLYNGTGIRNATVELKGNARVICWKASATYYLGGLSGASTTYLSGSSKSTDSGTMTWVVGDANTDETFRGVIDDRCSASGHNCKVHIRKVGDGDWRWTGKNIYSGTTEVNGGRLVVNGSKTGSGTVTVNEGGTLCGTGSVTGKVTVKSGGTLTVGDTLFNKKDILTLTSGATINAGAVVEIPLYRKETLNSCPSIKFGGATTMNGTLKLDMTNVTIDLIPNSSFALFSLASGVKLSGTIEAIEPAIPQEGLQWDTSSLFTTGRIYLRTDDYMNSIATATTEPVRVEYIGLDGTAVGPSAELCIVRKYYDDGTVRTEKRYARK